MCGNEMGIRRDINTPNRRFRGTIRVVVAGCVIAPLLMSVSAFAQVSSNQDQPLAGSSAPEMPVSETMPVDIAPEVLNTPNLRTINPNDIKRQNKRSNRWNPHTLTQPTGLSAASLRGQGKTRRTRHSKTGVKILPNEILSAGDLLLTGSAPVVPAAVPLGMVSRSDGVINLGSTLRGALFASPTFDNVNASVFKLDLGGQPCLGTAGECRANVTRRIDIGYAKNITTGKIDGFNLQLTPHGSVRVDGDSQSTLVGALVRIGDNLREGAEKKSNTWYFFAGADAEALTYTPNSMRRLTSGNFALQDQIIIGDAQAGLGYRIGDADLALTYYKRQAKAENYSYDEDAAALSITWKR